MHIPGSALDEWGLSVKKDNFKGKNKLGLATDLDLVYSCLDLRPKNLDQIIEKNRLFAGKTAGFWTAHADGTLGKAGNISIISDLTYHPIIVLALSASQAF